MIIARLENLFGKNIDNFIKYGIILSMYISNQISKKIYNNLLKYADEIILLPPFDKLPPPVSSHADMIMYKLRDSLLIHKDYYNENATLFHGISVTLTDEVISDVYPHDILLNALNLNGTVYGKTDSVSEYIKSDAAKIINIKQGYARCSACIVSDHAIITADRSIAAAVTDTDVLLIREGHINLDGYGYGFIGGASVKIGGKLLFFGDITRHPDHNAVGRFCEMQGVEIISLSDEILYDYGSMVIT